MRPKLGSADTLLISIDNHNPASPDAIVSTKINLSKYLLSHCSRSASCCGWAFQDTLTFSTIKRNITNSNRYKIDWLVSDTFGAEAPEDETAEISLSKAADACRKTAVI